MQPIDREGGENYTRIEERVVGERIAKAYKEELKKRKERQMIVGLGSRYKANL